MLLTRVGIATLEASEFTSLRERLRPVYNLGQAVDDQTSQGDLLDFWYPFKPLLTYESHLQARILLNFAS